ncbi:SDR family oxidoreductase [Rhizobium ruizarguesonis]|nr:SDR family oxidoreductase [Rhizobium ruizarguesonis]
MRTLAVEQGPGNIRFNAINPGIVLTPMADDVIDPAFAARLVGHTPLRRNGRLEEVADTPGCFRTTPVSLPGRRSPSTMFSQQAVYGSSSVQSYPSGN